MIDMTPVTIDVIETIDRFIDTEHAEARKWSNRELRRRGDGRVPAVVPRWSQSTDPEVDRG